MKRLISFLLLSFLVLVSVSGQEKSYLWKTVHSMKNEQSCFYTYLADKEKNNGIAVIICPGGSYHHLGMGTEGHQVAEWFNERGYNAFVLKYRVAMDGYSHPAMIQDFQRTMQLVREHAVVYGIDPDKIGAIGFSAGGHLVTIAAAFGDEDYLKPLGVISNVSLKPNFVIPVYPVVSMEKPYAHRWSKISLIGRAADSDTMHKFSMEAQVNSNMPPVFLLACKDDPTVDYRNSIDLDRALTKYGVNHTFILLEKGGHGFGMKNGWDQTLYSWLKKLYH